MADERVLGVVPARLGSTRFPGKVLTPLGGKPLVWHTTERLRRASLVDRVLVATDSAEVAVAVSELGAEVATVEIPCATGSDRVAAAVSGLDADIVVNLQADHPLISPVDVDRTVQALLDDERLDVTTLAYPSDNEASFVSRDAVKVVIDGAGRALYFSRAPVPSSMAEDGGKPLYLHHVGIYCFRRAALERFAALPQSALEKRESLEQLRALENGMTIGVVVTDRRTPGVDRPEDVPEVERRLAAD